MDEYDQNIMHVYMKFWTIDKIEIGKKYAIMQAAFCSEYTKQVY